MPLLADHLGALPLPMPLSAVRLATLPPKKPVRAMEPGADANRAYVGKIAADLVAGDDDLLLQKMWWFPLGKRACMGLRVALGVQTGLTTQQPGPNDCAAWPPGRCSRSRAGESGSRGVLRPVAAVGRFASAASRDPQVR